MKMLINQIPEVHRPTLDIITEEPAVAQSSVAPLQVGGFDFSLFKRFVIHDLISPALLLRNLSLEKDYGRKPPKATSTGTTIVGVTYKVSQRLFNFSV